LYIPRCDSLIHKYAYAIWYFRASLLPLIISYPSTINVSIEFQYISTKSTKSEAKRALFYKARFAVFGRDV
jgi:hypothetical protein